MTVSYANSKQGKIPLWINAINVIVILILVFQMLACYINPSLAYGTFDNTQANKQVILTLAGRNFVMIIVIILSLKLQNTLLLKITFVMNFAREFYDMILVGYIYHFSLKGIAMMASFLLFLIPYTVAFKKLGHLSAKRE